MRTLVDANVVLRHLLHDDVDQFPIAEQTMREGAYVGAAMLCTLQPNLSIILERIAHAHAGIDLPIVQVLGKQFTAPRFLRRCDNHCILKRNAVERLDFNRPRDNLRSLVDHLY